MKVSVVLPIFNGGSRGYLDNAILSVLDQTMDDYELIIVNDGSTDNTALICKKYSSDEKVKYIVQENKGLSEARNTGIKNAKGEFICFIDDDDAWKRDKLYKQIKFFEKMDDQRTGMVFSFLDLIDETGRKYGSQSHIAEGNIYTALFYGNIVDSPSSVMIKKEVFEKVGMFKTWMKSCEDYDMWLRIAKEYHIYSVKEYLVEYRVHKNKMSADLKQMEYFHFAALNDAIKTAPEYIKKETDRILNSSYQLFALKYYSSGDLSEFKDFYKKAVKSQGGVSKKLKLLYMASCIPGAFSIKNTIKQKVKK